MVKEKPNSTRTYDKDGFRRRAACICTRDESEQEILLVSASGDSDRYVVPGGGIEPDEDTVAAAVREVHEEAGVKGMLGRCLGLFENKEKMTRTSVYVMVVKELVDEWDDKKTLSRKRNWFSLDEARHQLNMHKPIQVQYLDLLSSPIPSETTVP